MFVCMKEVLRSRFKYILKFKLWTIWFLLASVVIRTLFKLAASYILWELSINMGKITWYFLPYHPALTVMLFYTDIKVSLSPLDVSEWNHKSLPIMSSMGVEQFSVIIVYLIDGNVRSCCLVVPRVGSKVLICGFLSTGTYWFCNFMHGSCHYSSLP